MAKSKGMTRETRSFLYQTVLFFLRTAGKQGAIKFNNLGKKIAEKSGNGIKTRNKTIMCRKCKKENEQDSKFCKYCGIKLIPGKCMKCESIVPEDSMFCVTCGTPADFDRVKG